MESFVAYMTWIRPSIWCMVKSLVSWVIQFTVIFGFSCFLSNHLATLVSENYMPQIWVDRPTRKKRSLILESVNILFFCSALIRLIRDEVHDLGPTKMVVPTEWIDSGYMGCVEDLSSVPFQFISVPIAGRSSIQISLGWKVST